MSAGVKLLLTDAGSPDASCRSRSCIQNWSNNPLRIELKIASKMLPRARVVSRAPSATRGLSTTAHILSNGPPSDRRLDSRPRPYTRRRSMSGSRLSQRWTSRNRSLQRGHDGHLLQHAPFRPTVVQSEQRFIIFSSCLSFSLFWFLFCPPPGLVDLFYWR